MISPHEDFIIENPTELLHGDVDVRIEFSEYDMWIYQTSFLAADHLNYLAVDEEGECLVISLMKNGKHGHEKGFKVLIWTEQKSYLKQVRLRKRFLKAVPADQDIIEALRPFISLTTVIRTTSPKVKKSLISLEQYQCVHRYKFGFVYCGEGQTTEESMFSNIEGSPAFEDFLLFLGAKIELVGWSGYAGGLDIAKPTTGTHSVYTKFQGNYEIMFHVSVMLPLSTDPQQVERKRHIGNDVVVVIFKEPGVTYSPDTITSHFNHVFLVVEPVYDVEVSYRVSCARKKGTPEFGPMLTKSMYKKDQYFRDLFLTKLINAERAAYQAPGFRNRIMRTRKNILSQCKDEAPRLVKNNPILTRLCMCPVDE